MCSTNSYPVFELPAVMLVTRGEHSNKLSNSSIGVIFFISPLSTVVSFKNIYGMYLIRPF
jgi:hypothetical protein